MERIIISRIKVIRFLQVLEMQQLFSVLVKLMIRLLMMVLGMLFMLLRIMIMNVFMIIRWFMVGYIRLIGVNRLVFIVVRKLVMVKVIMVMWLVLMFIRKVFLWFCVMVMMVELVMVFFRYRCSVFMIEKVLMMISSCWVGNIRLLNLRMLVQGVGMWWKLEFQCICIIVFRNNRMLMVVILL